MLYIISIFFSCSCRLCWSLTNKSKLLLRHCWSLTNKNKLLLCLFFICISANVFAEKKPTNDSSVVQVRSINTNTYKQQKEFQYKPVPPEPQSLWDKFWDWFWRQVNSLLSTKKGDNIFKATVIIIGVALIVFFVWKVRSMNRQSLFNANNTTLQYNIGEENIHALDFKTAINNAIANENYRLAIRLLYLQTLKTLADKLIIEWQLNKTNTMYVQEMTGHAQQHNFAQLTNVFEQAWYGQQQVDAQYFENVNHSFHQFQQHL